jgi:ketosteroid isomerase-like protein
MTNSTETLDPSQLPDTITGYLTSRYAGDLDVAVGYYADDATVIDEGNTYVGAEAIRGWLAALSGAYTFTAEVTGASRIAEDHYAVVQHLEGNFPGGVVDLRFDFTVRDGRISQLIIEP